MFSRGYNSKSVELVCIDIGDRWSHVPSYENPFHEPGGYSLAPLSSLDWLTIWRALRDPADDQRTAQALNALGALVQNDWLDSLPPVPDEGHDRDVLREMFRAHDQHEDALVEQRCGFVMSELSRLRSAESPFAARRLNGAARSLVSLAGDLFRIARNREEETERGDRETE